MNKLIIPLLLSTMGLANAQTPNDAYNNLTGNLQRNISYSKAGVPPRLQADWDAVVKSNMVASGQPYMVAPGAVFTRNPNGTLTYTNKTNGITQTNITANTDLSELAKKDPVLAEQWRRQYGYNAYLEDPKHQKDKKPTYNQRDELFKPGDDLSRREVRIIENNGEVVNSTRNADGSTTATILIRKDFDAVTRDPRRPDYPVGLNPMERDLYFKHMEHSPVHIDSTQAPRMPIGLNAMERDLYLKNLAASNAASGTTPPTVVTPQVVGNDAKQVPGTASSVLQPVKNTNDTRTAPDTVATVQPPVKFTPINTNDAKPIPTPVIQPTNMPVGLNDMERDLYLKNLAASNGVSGTSSTPPTQGYQAGSMIQAPIVGSSIPANTLQNVNFSADPTTRKLVQDWQNMVNNGATIVQNQPVTLAPGATLVRNADASLTYTNANTGYTKQISPTTDFTELARQDKVIAEYFRKNYGFNATYTAAELQSNAQVIQRLGNPSTLNSYLPGTNAQIAVGYGVFNKDSSGNLQYTSSLPGSKPIPYSEFLKSNDYIYATGSSYSTQQQTGAAITPVVSAPTVVKPAVTTPTYSAPTYTAGTMVQAPITGTTQPANTLKNVDFSPDPTTRKLVQDWQNMVNNGATVVAGQPVTMGPGAVISRNPNGTLTYTNQNTGYVKNIDQTTDFTEVARQDKVIAEFLRKNYGFNATYTTEQQQSNIQAIKRITDPTLTNSILPGANSVLTTNYGQFSKDSAGNVQYTSNLPGSAPVSVKDFLASKDYIYATGSSHNTQVQTGVLTTPSVVKPAVTTPAVTTPAVTTPAVTTPTYTAGTMVQAPVTGTTQPANTLKNVDFSPDPTTRKLVQDWQNMVNNGATVVAGQPVTMGPGAVISRNPNGTLTYTNQNTGYVKTIDQTTDFTEVARQDKVIAEFFRKNYGFNATYTADQQQTNIQVIKRITDPALTNSILPGANSVLTTNYGQFSKDSAGNVQYTSNLPGSSPISVKDFLASKDYIYATGSSHNTQVQIGVISMPTPITTPVVTKPAVVSTPAVVFTPNVSTSSSTAGTAVTTPVIGTKQPANILRNVEFTPDPTTRKLVQDWNNMVNNGATVVVGQPVTMGPGAVISRNTNGTLTYTNQNTGYVKNIDQTTDFTEVARQDKVIAEFFRRNYGFNATYTTDELQSNVQVIKLLNNPRTLDSYLPGANSQIAVGYGAFSKDSSGKLQYTSNLPDSKPIPFSEFLQSNEFIYATGSGYNTTF